jgi:hypothetical protein
MTTDVNARDITATSRSDGQSVYENPRLQKSVANASLRLYKPRFLFRRSIEFKTNRIRKEGTLMRMRN